MSEDEIDIAKRRAKQRRVQPVVAPSFVLLFS